MNRIYTLYVDGGITKELGCYFSYKLIPDSEIVFAKKVTLVEMQNKNLIPNYCNIFDSRGLGTNNIAEYAACYFGLKHFREKYGNTGLIIYQDSKLIINQVSGKYVSNHLHLTCWRDAVRNLMLNNTFHQWVPREKIVQQLGH